MVGPMIEPFWRRRVRHALLLLLVGLVLFMWLSWQAAQLARASFTSGYVLLLLILVLAAYRWRKRWPPLQRLGSSATWLQIHIYVGLAAFALFWFHVGFRWPLGALEQILATVFLLICGSGFYGLYVTRTVPRKLTAIGGEVIFEQIPVHRRQLVQRAEALALDPKNQCDILLSFIKQRLLPFLTRGRSFSYLAFPNGKTRRALLSEVENLKRYLTPEHQACTPPLQRLIQDKDDLDFHQALQGRLKGWLFIHVCLTGVLLAFAILHTLLVHVFQGSL